MRVLVAGIGNIFCGDDGFGVEVVRRLCDRGFPDGIHAEDFGVRGFDLANALCEPWDLVILVDAAAQGGTPGSVFVVEPDLNGLEGQCGGMADPHGLNPMNAIELAKTMGTISARVLLIGCEPASFETQGQVLALSTPVAAAVDSAMDMVDQILADFRESRQCAISNKGAAT